MEDWTPEREELEKRLAEIRKLGGEERVARQHAEGRFTVRERIDRLVDRDSFHEVGALTGQPRYDEQGNLVSLSPSNCVMGRARIDGRPVVVTGDDFTMRGGSAEATSWEKSRYPEQMAGELRLPIIRLLEGSGGGGSVKTMEQAGRANLPGGLLHSSHHHVAFANLATVPVVALALGPVAGLGAVRLAASHYSLMVSGKSSVFVAGPAVVAAIGETLDKEAPSKETLGGEAVQLAAGSVDDAVDSEEAAFAAVRRFLSYLPSSVDQLPARRVARDDVGRREEALFDIVPRDRKVPYKMRRIIEMVVDQGSFFEMGRWDPLESTCRHASLSIL